MKGRYVRVTQNKLYTDDKTSYIRTTKQAIYGRQNKLYTDDKTSYIRTTKAQN